MFALICKVLEKLQVRNQTVKLLQILFFVSELSGNLCFTVLMCTIWSTDLNAGQENPYDTQIAMNTNAKKMLVWKNCVLNGE